MNVQATNKKRTRNRLKKFFTYIKKAHYTKITNELSNYPDAIQNVIKNIHIDHPERIKGKIDIMIAENGSDFIRNLTTIRLSYFYPKYGNM